MNSKDKVSYGPWVADVIQGSRDLTIFATLYLTCYHESCHTNVTMRRTLHTCVLVCVSVLNCLTCYGVATISRLLKMIGIFCRILSLLWVSFAKETYHFEEPTNRSHPIPWIIPHTCHNESSLTSTHGGDQTSNISISKFNEFLVGSFEWRGLRWHTWKLVWKSEDSRENVFDMCVDSREYLLEILTVVNIFSPISSVCGLPWVVQGGEDP